jgi:16S rRNA (adenine1518-N6/adenine1519-N6)-dimethyltransferase
MKLSEVQVMPDRSSPSGARAILQQYGLHPKKRLGQNFLVDRNVLTRIADSCAISPDQYLVEIGPGLGGLTQELAQRSRGVLAIEVDSAMKPVLAELAAQQDNIRLLFQDILEVDIEAELCKAFALEEIPTYQVCANIPYNITTPIIFQLLERCPAMQAATLMMQKEVGARLLARPGSKDYGRLTLTTAYYAQVESVMPVSRNCFYPRPEVDSVVVRLLPQRPKKVAIKQEEVFKAFIRVAFQKRRKTILNISSEFFQRNKGETGRQLQQLGLAPNLRPENLSLEDVALLVNVFAP